MLSISTIDVLELLLQLLQLLLHRVLKVLRRHMLELLLRGGLEYAFDVVADVISLHEMDAEHRA